MWQELEKFLKKLLGRGSDPSRELAATTGATAVEEEDLRPCCGQEHVHIAFRGKSDDRLYLTYNRTWQEVRYYQPNGLRVFCVKCRRRLL